MVLRIVLVEYFALYFLLFFVISEIFFNINSLYDIFLRLLLNFNQLINIRLQ